MVSSQIPFPDKLDSKKPEEWKPWIERFECYRIAAGLDAKEEKVQINTLVYAMGRNANEIFKSFQLTEEDQVYETAKQRFETHFVGRTNVTFERARFNKRVQGAQESVIDFIEILFTLAETCQFGTLKEELIRDRIVVGIRNAVLSQKLMQDDTLTLDKAVKQAKSSELVKEHHKILKGDGKDGKINRIRDKKRRNVIDAANRHIKERNVQLLTPLAGNVRIVVITLQNVKAKSFFQSTTKEKMEIPT